MEPTYTREEFITLAVQSGYSKQSIAIQYVETHNKPKYSTDDFISLYHTAGGCMNYGVNRCKGLRPVFGLNGRTTAFSNGIMGNSSARQDWDY